MSAKRPPSRAKSRINPLLPIAGLAIIAVLIFTVFGNRGGGIEGLQEFPNLPRDHQAARVNYTMAPPVGGEHSAAWLNCGIYRLPVNNENAVHSLEHGAVWITYQPELAVADIDKLKALVRGRSHAILSPYPGIPAPVVAVAWGKRLEVEKADDPRIGQFLSAYENGPQTPEPGASCSGSLGTPDE
jgi:hypothetical protein